MCIRDSFFNRSSSNNNGKITPNCLFIFCPYGPSIQGRVILKRCRSWNNSGSRGAAQAAITLRLRVEYNFIPGADPEESVFTKSGNNLMISHSSRSTHDLFEHCCILL